ncbi:MAG TPA: hypothetical protein VKP30_07150 [Polyangiaceae bacterium]|nr:hypothetical protein [Polyangiaceae bacterium]
MRCQSGQKDCLGEDVGQICNQQGQWVAFPCSEGRRCINGGCTASESCEPGKATCLSQSVGQICSGQGQWLTFPCNDGRHCEQGTCAVGQSCTPGETSCLGPTLAQHCNEQGQWVSSYCGEGGRCEDGTCNPTASKCAEGARECVSDTIGQICTKQGTWVNFTCGEGEGCLDGECQGICAANTHECDTSGLQRICRSDGSGWITTDCPTGLVCKDGSCTGKCNSGQSECINSHFVRTCRESGDAYSDYACPETTQCINGECKFLPGYRCYYDSTLCADESTMLECAPGGAAYTVKACPKGTKCDPNYGSCMGTVCVPGTSGCVSAGLANYQGMVSCNADGSGYTIKPCKAGSQCLTNYMTDKAECYTPQCNRNEAVCGDRVNGTKSSTAMSRCQSTADGKLGWVVYQCDSPAICKQTAMTSATCSLDCIPGDQSCSSDGRGIETCNDYGEWETTPCNRAGGVEDRCVLLSETKQAVCGDRECAELTTAHDYQNRGRCALEKIRRCGPDGRLGTPVDCEEGKCTVDFANGMGVCDDNSRCDEEDGKRECVTDTMDSYRTCVEGHWQYTLCPPGEPCTELGSGLAACGGDCIEGQRRCFGLGYQDCGKDGNWGPEQVCKLGECNPKTNACEAVCAPGELRCSGDVLGASDGSSYGSRSYQICTASGSWGTATACAANALCRVSGLGEPLGCVECVGSEVAGGNAEGARDSRCNEVATGRQDCQEDNTWPSSVVECQTSSSGTAECVKQRDGTGRATCLDRGCLTSSKRATRCVGYEEVDAPILLDDCCAGDCDAEGGVCLHRRSHYDPTCPVTETCSTGRVDGEGNEVEEVCCAGFCVAGQGCLKLKAHACKAVEACAVTRVDHHSVCCGSCLAGTGQCTEEAQAPHPAGEFFTCGTELCWGLGSCVREDDSSGRPGAWFANCIEE